MSVDSGLAPYRGVGGTYTRNGVEEASGQFFEDTPDAAVRAAHLRYQEILAAQPHQGYTILHDWGQRCRDGAAVFTTNVDSMFARAGFDEHAIYEAHGSVFRSQCLSRCGAAIFPTPTSASAQCPACGGRGRPNTLMFGDFSFDDSRRFSQWEDLAGWFGRVPQYARVVIVEVGAGTEVPVVRSKCRALSASEDWPVIRINPDQPDLDEAHADGSVSLALTALEALQRIDEHINEYIATELSR